MTSHYVLISIVEKQGGMVMYKSIWEGWSKVDVCAECLNIFLINLKNANFVSMNFFWFV